MSERDGTGAGGARTKLAQADFDVAGTPYGDFVNRYFAGGSAKV